MLVKLPNPSKWSDASRGVDDRAMIVLLPGLLASQILAPLATDDVNCRYLVIVIDLHLARTVCAIAAWIREADDVRIAVPVSHIHGLSS